MATGRKPNTKDLNLEVAGVETDAHGAIIVDEYLKTTNPNIRAVGDVKGGLQFTYISLMIIGLSVKICLEIRSGKQVTVIRLPTPYLTWFEIKSKNRQLSVIDKIYVNGGLLFKKNSMPR